MKLNEIFSSRSLETIRIGTRPYKFINGVLKPEKRGIASSTQEQTEKAFGYKWKQEDTFRSPGMRELVKDWFLEKYQSPQKWFSEIKSPYPTLLDAGCGPGISSFEYWSPVFEKISYVGIDISEAIDVAYKIAEEKGLKNTLFIQENLADLPFLEPTFDIIFSEGVLHHTDNTEKTFSHLCQFLKPGGLFMFYVYRRKGPIREFTDDCIREKLQYIPAEEAWKALESLTKLGIALGKLNLEIEVPEDIKLLEIPAGKINLQRFFYWHIFKAFYSPSLSFEEMNHINFDWYAPRNAHRHTAKEVQNWCFKNQMEIQYIKEEPAGITCIAKRI